MATKSHPALDQQVHLDACLKRLKDQAKYASRLEDRLKRATLQEKAANSLLRAEQSKVRRLMEEVEEGRAAIKAMKKVKKAIGTSV